MTRNFLNQKHEPIFKKPKLGKLPTLKTPDFIEAETFAKNQNPNLQDSKRQFVTDLFFAKNPKDLTKQTPNGLRYLRWGGDGEAVQTEKC